MWTNNNLPANFREVIGAKGDRGLDPNSGGCHDRPADLLVMTRGGSFADPNIFAFSGFHARQGSQDRSPEFASFLGFRASNLLG